MKSIVFVTRINYPYPLNWFSTSKLEGLCRGADISMFVIINQIAGDFQHQILDYAFYN